MVSGFVVGFADTSIAGGRPPVRRRFGDCEDAPGTLDEPGSWIPRADAKFVARDDEDFCNLGG